MRGRPIGNQRHDGTRRLGNGTCEGLRGPPVSGTGRVGQVAISGKVLAFYLFRRAADNRQVDSDDELRERVWQQVFEDVM